MTPSIIDRANLLSLEVRQFAERRLLFALSRFDSRIQQVDLVVDDENGPRGGLDKSCRIKVILRKASDVVITDRDSDLLKSISRAAERASRAVARAIEKSQLIDRSRTGTDPSSLLNLG